MLPRNNSAILIPNAEPLEGIFYVSLDGRKHAGIYFFGKNLPPVEYEEAKEKATAKSGTYGTVIPLVLARVAEAEAKFSDKIPAKIALKEFHFPSSSLESLSEDIRRESLRQAFHRTAAHVLDKMKNEAKTETAKASHWVLDEIKDHHAKIESSQQKIEEGKDLLSGKKSLEKPKDDKEKIKIIRKEALHTAKANGWSAVNDNQEDRPSTVLFQPWVEGKSFGDYRFKSLLDLCIACKKIAMTLNRLHSARGIHGDVSFNNVLLNEEAWLVDFGMAYHFDENTNAIPSDDRFPPEIWNRKFLAAGSRDVFLAGKMFHDKYEEDFKSFSDCSMQFFYPHRRFRILIFRMAFIQSVKRPTMAQVDKELDGVISMLKFAGNQISRELFQSIQTAFPQESYQIDFLSGLLPGQRQKAIQFSERYKSLSKDFKALETFVQQSPPFGLSQFLGGVKLSSFIQTPNNIAKIKMLLEKELPDVFYLVRDGGDMFFNAYKFLLEKRRISKEYLVRYGFGAKNIPYRSSQEPLLVVRADFDEKLDACVAKRKLSVVSDIKDPDKEYVRIIGRMMFEGIQAEDELSLEIFPFARRAFLKFFDLNEKVLSPKYINDSRLLVNALRNLREISYFLQNQFRLNDPGFIREPSNARRSEVLYSRILTLQELLEIELDVDKDYRFYFMGIIGFHYVIKFFMYENRNDPSVQILIKYMFSERPIEHFIKTLPDLIGVLNHYPIEVRLRFLERVKSCLPAWIRSSDDARSVINLVPEKDRQQVEAWFPHMINIASSAAHQIQRGLFGVNGAGRAAALAVASTGLSLTHAP